MKALYALLTGALLVALTALGLTALASADDNNPPVFGFTNESCSSLYYKWFPNLAALIAYDGTEDSNGYTWNFGSYLEEVENYECTVLRYGEVTVTRKAPKKKQSTGGGSGGGGSGGRGTPPPSPPQNTKPDPSANFGDDEAEKLKNCLQKKLKALNLEAVEGEGCMTDIDLEYRKTNYTWQTHNEQGNMGLTIYKNDTNIPDVSDYTVLIDPASIGQRVSNFNHAFRRMKLNLSFDNLAAHVALDELVHTIQGTNALDADEDWENPPPYEWYDMQVQANLVSYSWYKQLHSNNNPPISRYTESIIDKHRDGNCNITGKFKTKKERYQTLEVKKANSALIVDKENNVDEPQEMEDLKNWFRAEMPPTDISAAYDEGADLGCD